MFILLLLFPEFTVGVFFRLARLACILQQFDFYFVSSVLIHWNRLFIYSFHYPIQPVNGFFNSPPLGTTRPAYFLPALFLVAFCNLVISSAEASTSPRFAFTCTPVPLANKPQLRRGKGRAYESLSIARQFLVPVRVLLAVLAVLSQDALLSLLENLCRRS